MEIGMLVAKHLKLVLVSLGVVLALDLAMRLVHEPLIERLGADNFYWYTDCLAYLTYSVITIVLAKRTITDEWRIAALTVGAFGFGLGVYLGLLFVIGVGHSGHFIVRLQDLPYVIRISVLTGVIVLLAGMVIRTTIKCLAWGQARRQILKTRIGIRSRRRR